MSANQELVEKIGKEALDIIFSPDAHDDVRSAEDIAEQVALAALRIAGEHFAGVAEGKPFGRNSEGKVNYRCDESGDWTVDGSYGNARTDAANAIRRDCGLEER